MLLEGVITMEYRIHPTEIESLRIAGDPSRS